MRKEDFGIVPVEAQACGTPVIAFGKGGVTETVIPVQNTERRTQNTDDVSPTGIFFNEQIPSALIDAVQRFEVIEGLFDPYEIRKNAERFSIERFKKEFEDFVDEQIKMFFE